MLTFENAAVEADFAKAPAAYRAVWSSFDNTTHSSSRIGETAGRSTRLEAPAGLPRRPGVFVKVELSSVGAQQRSWETPVNAYFRHDAAGWRLVGFERQP